MSERKKKNESEGSGFGWWLAAAAGAAALAYGAKKVYDAVVEEEAAEKKACDLNRGSWLNNNSQSYLESDEEGATVQMQSSSNSSSLPWRDLGSLESQPFSLTDQLEDYFERYVKVSERRMRKAKTVLKEVKELVVRSFKRYLPQLQIGELVETGSTTEGLKVIRPDEFDVLIPITIDVGHDWELEEGEHTVMDVPGYRLVKQVSKGSPYDRYTVGSYLSPDRVRSAFQGALQRAIYDNNTGYNIRPSVHGPAVTLTVAYDGDQKFTVDFVPAIIFGKQWSVATPHPKVREDPKGNQAYANYWRKSYSVDENLRLCNLPPNSCHKQCLMIMKAIRLNHYSQFGMFSSYILKTILLHMMDEHMDEEDWKPTMLTERTLDFLHSFSDALDRGRLRPYFETNCNCNLFEGCHPDSLTKLRDFIQKRLGKNNVYSLLESKV